MPMLDIGSTSYYMIAWALLTLPWLVPLMVYQLSSKSGLHNASVSIACLAYIAVNIYLIRHAHHLSDFPFISLIKWGPIWIFACFKLVLAILYTILIKVKCHPVVFLIIVGAINLMSAFNFVGFIVLLSLE